MSADAVLMMQGGVPVVAAPGDLPVAQPSDLAALTKRVAALEARATVVALTGALPVAALQIGTVALPIAVAGLLVADRVSVMPMADLPPGLQIVQARPLVDGRLAVRVSAALSVPAATAPVPLAVTAFRA